MLSSLCLLKSSYPSLPIESNTTKAKGATAVTGDKGDILGMLCNIAIHILFTYHQKI
jgi:hypothetical protein